MRCPWTKKRLSKSSPPRLGSPAVVENAFPDGQKRGTVGSSSSKIEDQYVTFTRHLSSVEAVRNSHRFVNDLEDVKTRDGPSVLGGLSLGTRQD